MLEPQIVETKELLVVGYEASFVHALSPDANSGQVIGQLWNRFVHDASKIPCCSGEEMLGVIYGRPEEQRSHRDELQYIAAVTVTAVGSLPEGMVAHTIPAGLFADFQHRGSIDRIGRTVEEIYRVWLPQSEYEHAEVADVEFYDHRFNCESEESIMEYRISVRPKKTV